MTTTTHTVHITPDAEDMSDPFSRTGDTHSWQCTCGATQANDPLAFTSSALHLRYAERLDDLG